MVQESPIDTINYRKLASQLVLKKFNKLPITKTVLKEAGRARIELWALTKIAAASQEGFSSRLESEFNELLASNE